MPGADGIELLRYLAKQGSRAQVLVASGNDERVLATAAASRPRAGTQHAGALRKPILLPELEAILRRRCAASRRDAGRLGLGVKRNENRSVLSAQGGSRRTETLVGARRGSIARWRHPQMALFRRHASYRLRNNTA